jgi:hypothetical protein
LCGIGPHKFLPSIFEYRPDDHCREAVEFLSDLNNKVLKKEAKVGVIVAQETNEHFDEYIHPYLYKVIVSKSLGRVFHHGKTPII